MVKEGIDFLKTGSRDSWRKIGTSRRAGLLVPLFSVYSKNSVGIGDFADLRMLVDLCEGSGSSMLQLLPMNEVGSTFCPYDAVSSFALEPSYICLETIAACRRKPLNQKIDKIRKMYPAGAGHVDYAIKDAKLAVLLEAFSEERGTSSGEAFSKFAESNRHWLDDFALFKVIKSCHAGKSWYEWPAQFRDREEGALRKFAREHEKEVLFQKWLQWTAYEQFRAARQYAASRSVLFKGDLPILISRDSSDVWSMRQFFKLDFAAGAPIDMYCAKGQRWGMPTYDWDAIADDRFRYLKGKLRYAGNFYDILRVDHVVGLFRIWSIPYNDPSENEGLNGVFDPADEAVWEDHGRAILSVMVKSTDMLLCAEDLGIIPAACPKTLEDFGIPGNDVQRWMKDWQKRHDFLSPDEYRQLSVSMLSTHDTTNWAAWWNDEAGTVDEALFARKCADRGVALDRIIDNLFDKSRSRHGRLRWQEMVSSKEILIGILGKREEEVRDFIDLYENSYMEKEKLWSKLGLKGRMREKCDREIVGAVFAQVLESRSIFSINLLNDCLYLEDMVKGDPYRYRINKPGTISRENWSLTLPMSLEELMGHKLIKRMKQLAGEAGRK
jgi:4-alpha-glucanotransferase